MQRLFHRLTIAFLTIPRTKDWLEAVRLLLIFALLYLPIGFTLGFLKIEVQSSWQTIASVIAGTFFVPSLLEEFGFRVLLLPHPTELTSPLKRWTLSILSWFGFIAYHLHPFTPSFFKSPGFLIGAGLIGIACVLSYLRSGSVWIPVAIHWFIVVVWLLFLGGLEKFQG